MDSRWDCTPCGWLLQAANQAPLDIRVYYTPVEKSHFYSYGRGASLEQVRGILHEYAAIVVYWWRRWI